MEGFLVRLPAPKHDTRSTSTRRRPSRNDAARLTRHRRVIAGRVLYYTLGEGYLTGYLSPTDVEPVETFQLTAHSVDVDVMYSTQVFQVFARRFSPPVAVAPRGAAVCQGDLSDSSDDEEEQEEEGAVDEAGHDDYGARVELDGDYSVVFFAATKELVRAWSTKILNWNRYVFSTTSGGLDQGEEGPAEDGAALQDAHEAVVQAFRASCVGDMFSPRVQLHPRAIAGLPSPPPSSPRALPPTGAADLPSADVEKPSTTSEPPSRPWWTLNARSRRISSHALRR